MNTQNLRKTLCLVLALAACLLAAPAGARAGREAAKPAELPVPGMVTMVDLGADKCIPCRMMAPILEELRETYKGRAAIVFVDVWKDRQAARDFGIRAIPTQIFYAADGKEALRHEGFMGKEHIKLILEQLGVRPAGD